MEAILWFSSVVISDLALYFIPFNMIFFPAYDLNHVIFLAQIM